MKTRKPLRLKYYNYDEEGAYHLILCSNDREKIFSNINTTTGELILSSLGELVDETINYYVNNIDKSIDLVNYVIMPNHIHMLVMLSETDSNKNRITKFISSIKKYTIKKIGKGIWQRGFYDHIIRDDEDLLATMEYLQENPLKWAEDEYYAEDKFSE